VSIPPPPEIDLSIVHDAGDGARATGGFLDLRRLRLTAGDSAAFPYDLVTRKSLDAVVIAAHYRDASGQRWVYFRSCVRPPLAFRGAAPHMPHVMWELPAGLVDAGETERECAVRELEEELGFRVELSRMLELGAWMVPVPAMIAERHVFFHVEVDPSTRGVPTEDGHALEKDGHVIAVPLGEALDACRSGVLRDEKSELALRRLAELP
jgi:ADP-ribose pyrophosphatase